MSEYVLFPLALATRRPDPVRDDQPYVAGVPRSIRAMQPKSWPGRLLPLIGKAPDKY